MLPYDLAGDINKRLLFLQCPAESRASDSLVVTRLFHLLSTGIDLHVYVTFEIIFVSPSLLNQDVNLTQVNLQ